MTHLLMGAGLGVPGVPAFVCDAATFDGTNDYMTRGAGLTGAADNSQGTLSLWVSFSATGDMSFWDVTNGKVYCRRSSNQFFIDLTSPAGSRALFMQTAASYSANSIWRHILASWDTNFATTLKLKHLYVTDVSALSFSTDNGSGAVQVDYTHTNWSIGATVPSLSQKLNGDLAEVWFAPTYIDLSVTANRRKFISASGKPVSLGSDGSTPTGSVPLMYHHLDDGEAVANFATNRGSGGNFTITGTLATASTSPSD